MAQGTIKKGFFFYFGLFVLLLVSIFLICLVIMLFNPGKTVLWMKYFSGNETVRIAKTTGESSFDVNYSTLTDITINCDYADVTVQRNKEYSGDYIVIRNNAKGFAGSKNYTAFDYEVTMDGTSLTIDITEPNGFLYFSKDIEIIINDNVGVGGINLSGISLTVNADGDCDIDLGGSTNKEEESVSLRSINLNTEDGDITFNSNFNSYGVSGDYRMYTGSGRIRALNDVTYAMNKTGSGIMANTDVTLGTNKGRIDLDFVSLGGNTLTIENRKGTAAISSVYAGGVMVERCVQGNYKFDYLNCNLSFAKAEDSIISPVINVGEIDGDFHLSSKDESDAPVIKIDKIAGDLTVTAGKGSVNVAEADGVVDITSNRSTSVKVTLSEFNTNPINVSNDRGDVYLKFLGSVSNNAIITVDSSDVEIDFTKNGGFTAYCYKNNGESNDPLSSGDVKVSIRNDEVTYEYNRENGSLNFNGLLSSGGNVTINTNGEVQFNLVNVA